MSLPPKSGKNQEEQRLIDAAWDTLHANVLPIEKVCRRCDRTNHITKGSQLKQTTGYGLDSLWSRCQSCDAIQIIYGNRELKRFGIEHVLKGLDYL